MPTITEQKLELNKSGTDNVEVKVHYVAHFSILERNLMKLGLTFNEQIDLFGIDGRNSKFLKLVRSGPLQVTAATTEKTVDLTQTVPRAVLDEDTGIFFEDDDEIVCRIQISTVGFPLAIKNDFTDQVILSEQGVFNPNP
ncbi:MAG TPA: hypothetical protein VF721_11555 [Pyrinomonadaceae bacterium]|jgi:hypothetical protein